MGGRAEETTNAWDPSEGSVAQRTAESGLKDIFRHHPLPPGGLEYKVKAERRKIHRVVYQGSPWVDLDAIEAEAVELMQEDPGQAERFFGNRIVAGADKAFDLETYKSLMGAIGIERRRKVTLGFDGALTQDATGLVAVDIETGHKVVVGLWTRPQHLPEDDDWAVPLEELNEAVEFAFTFWDVWKLYGDPPHYTDDLNRWAGLYGEDRVVRWWTNSRRKMAYALKAYRTDMRPGVMSHGPLDDSPEAAAAYVAPVDHHGNAVRRKTNIRDDETGKFMWLIGKDGQKSPRKIDLAMAGCLAWEARGDAIRAGVLNKPTYAIAAW
jgi:hypothetical protein